MSKFLDKLARQNNITSNTLCNKHKKNNCFCEDCLSEVKENIKLSQTKQTKEILQGMKDSVKELYEIGWTK